MRAETAKRMLQAEALEWLDDNYQFTSRIKDAISNLKSYITLSVDPEKWDDHRIKIAKSAKMLGYSCRFFHETNVININF